MSLTVKVDIQKQFRSIIDIHFYETFSTLTKVEASPKSACTPLHFN